MWAERVEKVAIHLLLEANKLNKADIAKAKRLFKITLLPDQTLTVDYSLAIFYDAVVTQLNTLLAFLDKASVVKVNTKELAIGKCLAQELFCKLEQIEKKYENTSRGVERS